ncbi:MAG: hypothetical protein QGH51_05210 [Planctomycetota bacterium]|jgi:hypothetical protein|nr:hypothetical protein [Planctomycetota bacterium]MDP6941411.1 hypothetical protein [Planctomycetota bacterium]
MKKYLFFLPALLALTLPLQGSSSNPYTGILATAEVYADGSMGLNLQVYGVTMEHSMYAMGQTAIVDVPSMAHIEATVTSVDPVAEQAMVHLVVDAPFLNIYSISDQAVPFGRIRGAYKPISLGNYFPEGPNVAARGGFMVNSGIKARLDINIAGCELD